MKKCEGLALAASLFLASCSVLSPRSPEAQAAWDLRRAQLEQITQFTLLARVTSGVLGPKGSLHWRQRPDDFEMRVSGPLGVNAMTISGNSDAVAVRTAQESFRTTDPEGLLREQLGWAFPLRQLRWWVLSLPAPSTDANLELDAYGRLLSLEQDGWTLEFKEYQPVDQNAGALDLPRKFELGNDEATIRVVVDAWSNLAPRL